MVRLVLTTGRASDSNSKRIRAPIAALIGLVLLGSSAAAGAWIHSHFKEGASLDVPALDLYSARVVGHSQDKSEQVEVLAAKLGDLQAKVIEIEGLSRRVEEIAGELGRGSRRGGGDKWVAGGRR